MSYISTMFDTNKAYNCHCFANCTTAHIFLTFMKQFVEKSGSVTMMSAITVGFALTNYEEITSPTSLLIYMSQGHMVAT